MLLQALKATLLALITIFTMISCFKEEDAPQIDSEVPGFSLLNEISGHWVGKNETAFGVYDWFAFDFRPISASHIHSIYEGASAQNIINSFFVGKYDGKNHIMARNGGWLGEQYRATYFILDKVEESNNEKYYRLVDVVGGVDRSYMELTFKNGEFKFEAFKDNSGTLDQPKLHMSFIGKNYNPDFADHATGEHNFPSEKVEKNLENEFKQLIDSDSALFLKEDQDPFPRSEHSYLSDLKIDIPRTEKSEGKPLVLFISSEPIVNEEGSLDFENLDTKLIRTITIYGDEEGYTATYLHPDNYYLTVFVDNDDNLYPSQGDLSNYSKMIEVSPESYPSTMIAPDLIIN